ncbi:MAG: hypothetical protein JXA18_03005 [Chitinispirillaceae bacterium]|nr:hypothetical protein [Chitinispirillaceae bacterium]
MEKIDLFKALRNDRGSVLVGTVAFAIIMAIAGSGLLMLAANSVSREQEALDDDRALLAAESGLQVGLRWLAVTGNWDANHATGVANFFNAEIGEMHDTVSLVIEDGDLVLKSRATRPDMDYFKEVSCTVERNEAPDRVFFNALDGVNGLDNIWFDGPFHSNEPIYINTSGSGDPNAVRFVNGPVTVTNVDDEGNLLGWLYGTGPSGNNYDFGLQVDGLSEDGMQGSTIDPYFDNTFTHSQDSLVMPAGLTAAPFITLQQHHRTLLWPIRSTLYFHVDPTSHIGNYTYYYNASTGAPDIRSEHGTINGNIIYAPGSDISVLGKVAGRATVVTDPGRDIYPVGDLTYDDFDKAICIEDAAYNSVRNYGAGFDHSNFLALVSGGNIRFEEGQEQYMKNPSTGEIADIGSNRTIFLTAALIATNPGKGIVWDTTSAGNISLGPGGIDYNIRAVGSRIVNTFFNYSKRGDPLANDRFRFFFDRRLLGNLTAPGLSGLMRRSWVDGNAVDLYLLKTVWRERNIPK